tara:strand:- start:344 stop:616 length:273 start_codon:yes stop_codon:yes gene_type:complete
MASNKPLKTTVNNKHLTNVLKLVDTYQIKTEKGEWEVEKGTYQAIIKAGEHFRCEMAKQSRQRRKTMKINVITDPEIQAFNAEQFRAPEV